MCSVFKVCQILIVLFDYVVDIFVIDNVKWCKVVIENIIQ